MAKHSEKITPGELLSQLSLEEVRAERARLEAERDARLEELQREIDALAVIEKALDVRENGKPQRRSRKSRKGREEPESGPVVRPTSAALDEKSNFDKLRIYLEAAGRARVDTIVRDTGVHKHVAVRLLNGRGDFVEDRDRYWSLVR